MIVSNLIRSAVNKSLLFYLSKKQNQQNYFIQFLYNIVMCFKYINVFIYHKICVYIYYTCIVYDLFYYYEY